MSGRAHGARERDEKQLNGGRGITGDARKLSRETGRGIGRLPRNRSANLNVGEKAITHELCRIT